MYVIIKYRDKISWSIEGEILLKKKILTLFLLLISYCSIVSPAVFSADKQTKLSLPQTGQSGNSTVWILLLLVSVACVLGLVLARRSQKNKE